MTFLVRRKGLEPPTYWFVASHSIQLSYRRIPHSPECSDIIARRTEKCKYFFSKNAFFFFYARSAIGKSGADCQKKSEMLFDALWRCGAVSRRSAGH